jgi:hypothetical protein
MGQWQPSTGGLQLDDRVAARAVLVVRGGEHGACRHAHLSELRR